MFGILIMLKSSNIKNIIYKIFVLFKGVFSFFEIMLGIVISVISTNAIYDLTRKIFSGELVEDPKDIVANYLINLAQNFSLSVKEFVSSYLLIHGLINLLIFYTIWNKKKHYYPVILLLLGLLVIYQIIEFVSQHSILIFLVTIVDAVIIYFVFNEYRNFEKHFMR